MQDPSLTHQAEVDQAEAPPPLDQQPTADPPAPSAEPLAPTAEPLAGGLPADADHAADEDGLAEAAAELDAVEGALARLEDGSLDSCEVCGAPIGRDRLLQDPLLTRCPQHAATG